MSRPRTTRSRKKPPVASEQAMRPEVMDLLLGWKHDDQREPIGFGAPRAPEAAIQGEVPILYGEDRHLLTIAPTGAMVSR